jgi:hypothetical protein
MAPDWFDEIYLESDQVELLSWMVESEQRLPRERHGAFLLLGVSGGDILIHAHVPERPGVRVADLDALAEARLLRFGINAKGNRTYSNTPLGRRYLNESKLRSQRPVGTMEDELRQYLDADRFRSAFPKAYETWLAAERALWEASPGDRVTGIGHTCRDAMQAFATELLEVTNAPPPEPDDPAKTTSRIRAAIAGFDVSERQEALLNASVVYWVALNDAVQRVTHGAQKAGDPVEWDDARQIVFQTLVVMFEIGRVVTSG